MNKVLSCFDNLTSMKAISYHKIKEGITNDNYKIETDTHEYYVLRIPKKYQIGLNREEEQKIIDLLRNYHIDVPLLYFDSLTGIKITKFIPNRKIHAFPNQDQLKQFLFELKKLHSISYEEIQKIADFDPFIMLETYKSVVGEELFIKEKKIIKDTLSLYHKYPKVLCHNDLLFANILFCKKKAYLIDYEYAGKNIALFDLASFVGENNIEDLKNQTIFLQSYFDEITVELLKDFGIMLLFQDILWGYWAKMMYIQYQNLIYEDIFQQKSERYHSRIRNF